MMGCGRGRKLVVPALSVTGEGPVFDMLSPLVCLVDLGGSCGSVTNIGWK